MNTSYYFIFILALGCLLGSCNKEVTIGSEIIEDQPIAIDYNEIIDITAETVYGDPALMYRNSPILTRRTYLLGELTDPNFGVTGSTVFVTPRVSETVPDFSGASLDSVIMVLPYDTLGQYGDSDVLHDLSVYRLRDAIDVASTDTLFSDMCFDFEDTPISSFSFDPEPTDSSDVYSPSVDSIIRVLPQIRIPLDAAVWNDVLSDTLNTRLTQNIVDIVKGYAIQSMPNGSDMYGINLSNTSTARIQVFYQDSIKKVFSFDLSSLVSDKEESVVKHNCYVSDYNGSLIESVIGDDSAELNYVQGMQGFDVVYDLSGVLSIQDEFVNYAVIEVFAQKEEGVDPLNFLIASYRNDDGDLVRIRDLTSSAAGFFDSRFEEVEIDGVTLLKHEVIVTNHIIDIVNGDITNTSLTLLADNKRENPRHSIFYSPNHPLYPACLKLITTKP